MGTYEGIKNFKPRYSERLGKTYAYIPKGYAAMSAPAFAALKAQVLVCEGTLGFHRLYKIENGHKITTHTQDLMLNVLMITMPKHNRALVPKDKLRLTTPSRFYYHGEYFHGEVRNWRDLPSDVEMFSTADDLLDFKLPPEIEADLMLESKRNTIRKTRRASLN